MAKRGMLPKFRPAQLGREAPVRPTIRPVKAAPPPPPPSPPRKMSSGFSPKTSAAAAEALAPLDSDGERATAVAPYHREPPTLDRRGDAFDAPSVEVRDEDLPSTAAVPRGRVDAMVVTFDDETQARAETRPLDRGYDPATLAPSTAPVAADMNIPYDSLPSLEVRRPYDTYEAEFSERDPVTAMHGRRESAHIRRADVAPAALPSNDLPSFEVSHAPHGRPSGASWGTFSSLGDSAQYDRRAFNDPDFNVRAKREAYDDGAYRPAAPPVNDYVPSVETEAPPAFPRREESGPRALPRNDYEPAPSSVWNDASDVAPHDAMGIVATGFSTVPPSPEMVAREHDSLPPVEPYIPPAPRVPAEAYGGPSPFVMGVQPIRNQRTDAWPPAPSPMPAPEPMAPPVVHYQPQPLPSPMQAMHQAPAAHPAYAQPPSYVHASPRNMNVTPQPGSLAPAVIPQGHPTHRGQPQGAVAALGAPAPQQNRIGRFAWFVAGVAFGITFAIFATGFFAGGSVGASKAAASEPPAPAQTTIAQASAPPPVATTAQPVVAPVPAPPPVGTVAAATPATLPPSGTPASPAAPVAPAVSPKPAPIAKAPPPVVVRRPAPPPQRRMPATTEARPVRSGGDDEAPSPRVAAPPPEAGDLLGAALR